MKKASIISLLFIALIAFMSCSRGITTYEAANGKARCGRYIK